MSTMKPGGQRKVRVPPEAAYGAQGAGDKVPPNAHLLFDVELVRPGRCSLRVLVTEEVTAVGEVGREA